MRKKKRGRPEKSETMERVHCVRMGLELDNMLTYICGLYKKSVPEMLRKLIYDEFQRAMKK